ncbi:MAG: hypothetical protein AABW49_04905 [Nanoarchaeota archaeon]
MKKVIDKLPEIKIRHVGTLELDEFYRWMKRWLKFKGWWKGETNEMLYDEKINPNDSKNITIRWEVTKKQTPFLFGRINILYMLIGISRKKVNIDGHEIKLYDGDFEIRINTTVERTDDEGNIRKIFEETINKEGTQLYIDDIFDDASDLVNEIKAVFNQYA